MAEILDTIWGVPRFAVVSYPCKIPNNRTVREFVEALRRLDSYGLRVLIELGEVPKWIRESVKQALIGKPWIVQISDTWAPILWPTGARLIACAPDKTPTAKAISSAATGFPRIILIAEGSADPTQPNRQLAEIVAGPVYNFDAFLAAVLQ